ncbi:uncharacterized protein LOC141601789 [Silene latifolia]|uniref:uncharacterized protein LOC141601789 n=1 Tax=Silene latifolia TaxID=37657 RepID=UPI003D775493
MLPRHAFLVWLVAQQKLLTQDRLQRFGMVQVNVCYLCGVEEEDHEHIFFQCQYSELCRSKISQWCKVELPRQHCIAWWLHWRARSTCKKKVVAMILANFMAMIWWCRNRSRVDGLMMRPEMVVSLICNEVIVRVGQCRISSRHRNTQLWLDEICNGRMVMVTTP